jgi:hypothetical protein
VVRDLGTFLRAGPVYLFYRGAPSEVDAFLRPVQTQRDYREFVSKLPAP